MSAARKYIVEDYLRLDLEAKEARKSKFISKEITNYAGASEAHCEISTNTFGELYIRLKGKSCRPYAFELKVQVNEDRTFVYPDIVVACEPKVFAHSNPPALLNPSIIIQVLSLTTASYDLNEKLILYKSSESIDQIIYIDSLTVRVISHVRQSTGWAMQTILTHLAQVLNLPFIMQQLPLSEIYGTLLDEGLVRPYSRPA